MRCKIPPHGWHCSREAGHEGPCAAIPSLFPDFDRIQLLKSNGIAVDSIHYNRGIEDANNELKEQLKVFRKRLTDLKTSCEEQGGAVSYIFALNDVLGMIPHEV